MIVSIWDFTRGKVKLRSNVKFNKQEFSWKYIQILSSFALEFQKCHLFYCMTVKNAQISISKSHVNTLTIPGQKSNAKCQSGESQMTKSPKSKSQNDKSRNDKK